MISICCPTRQREDDIERLIATSTKCADNPIELEYVFYIDSDDDSYSSFIPTNYSSGGITMLGWPFLVQSRWVIGERYAIKMSDMWNKCQEVATGPYYFLAGDDVAFRTQGWDTKFMEAFDEFPDKIAFIHGLDGSVHDDVGHGTHGMIHKNWVDTVGYAVPPYFSMDYIDTWLNQVADMIGRHVQLKDVLTEHMHIGFGKAEVDQNYTDRTERGWKDNVSELYNSLHDERVENAAKLTKFIEEFNV